LTAVAIPASKPEIESILDVLRASGGRVTTARRAVIAALLDVHEHATADDVAEIVQASHPDVHRSTIYRTLADLEELGIVDHVHLGHGRAVYHVAGNAHQHLVCDSCAAVIEVPAAVFAPLARRLRTGFGFELAATPFAVTGRCATCASASQRGDRD
jgi:Fe2+ or Zn2+ uptake regulation protein